jgi:hypothetical protein
MISQKYFKNRSSGTVIVDILMALALSVLFIAIMTSTSIDSYGSFERAKERSLLLDAYGSSSSNINSRPYGNDRIQTDLEAAPISNASSTLRFTQVLMRSLPDLIKAAGTPLCSVDFSDKGKAPAGIVQVTMPIDPLLPLTDLEVRDSIAYISADSSTASDPDLFIVDIRDVASPAVLSSINTGPGIASMALAGKRIYAASPSSAAQLHIIRLDGLARPVLEKKYRLPPPYDATATPPLASSIFYSGGDVYIGTEKWDGEELGIIDVSDPLWPVRVGGLEIGSKINDILVRDGLAYIASGNQGQLIIADARDPAHPIITNTFSPSGWSRQEGKSISVFEGSIDFSRTSGGYNIASDHEAFVWPENPFAAPITALAGPVSVDIPGGVYGIISDRSNVYLATRQNDKEFQIFDHSFTASTSRAYPLPIAPQTMACDGDRLYILAHTAPVIYEISFK